MDEPYPSDFARLRNEGDDAYLPLFAALGKTIAHWAMVELCLSDWFCVVSGMPQRMANDVFFSAKSFKGRADMVRAAIENSAASQEDRAFAAAVLHKAETYSSFRNGFAHGVPHTQTVDGVRMPILIEPYGERDGAKLAAGTTVAQFERAAINFSMLAGFMSIAHLENLFRQGAPVSPPPEVPLSRLQRLVELLPNEPVSDQPSQKQQARSRRLQSAEQKSARQQNRDKGS